MGFHTFVYYLPRAGRLVLLVIVSPGTNAGIDVLVIFGTFLNPQGIRDMFHEFVVLQQEEKGKIEEQLCQRKEFPRIM